MSDKKTLTLYCQYYYPEVASLAQLCTDLCEGLSDEFDITVVCSVPCYLGKIDDKYSDKKYYFEEHNGVKIVRVRVPSYDKQNKISRVKKIIAYFFRTLSVSFKYPEQIIFLQNRNLRYSEVCLAFWQSG